MTSVACVDAADKVAAYRSWLGLDAGHAVRVGGQGGSESLRTIAADHTYTAPTDRRYGCGREPCCCPAPLGHLMIHRCRLDRDGAPIGEGISRAFVVPPAHCRYGPGTPIADSPPGRDLVKRNARPDEVALPAPFRRVEQPSGVCGTR